MPRRELMTVTSTQKHRQKKKKIPSLYAADIKTKAMAAITNTIQIYIYLLRLPSSSINLSLALSLPPSHYFSITLHLNISFSKFTGQTVCEPPLTN